MKSATDWIVVGLAVMATLCALIFLPAIELIPAQVEPGSIAPGLSPVRSEQLMQVFKGIGEQAAGLLGHPTDLKVYTEGDPRGIGAKSPGELQVYAMWAVFISIALVLASLAYSLIGRYDAEEKTVLPVKK